MPRKVLPTILGFVWLSNTLENWGFRIIPDPVFRKRFRDLKLEAPRSRRGRETGFTFSANGLEVFVWTTWLAREGEARDSDAGWIVITQKGKSRYYAHPVHRTKNFLENLARLAWIAKRRVTHRPRCPACQDFMDITFGHGLKQRYWRCNQLKKHPGGRPRWCSWDTPLPPRAREFVKALRLQRAKQKKRAKEEAERQGKEPPRPALLIRKPWNKRVALTVVK